MACIQANVQTTMNPHQAGSGPAHVGEWARNVATLSAVNGVLLASGQRIVRRQMELAQDMMADTRKARVPARASARDRLWS